MDDGEEPCDCHPEERTGGDHKATCPQWMGPECTCYEIIGGHQQGCALYPRTVPKDPTP